MDLVVQCVMTFVFLTVSSIDFTVGHPQCLDFLPPFENEESNYCSEYHPNSCCTANAATDVKKAVNTFLKNSDVRRRAKRQCSPYLHNVTCTTCSPYAAHVYEAENAEVPRVFPSLCYDYCLEFYSNCYPLFFDYYNLNSTGYKRGRRSARRFCKRHISNDPAYCYPTVVQGPVINDTQTNPNCDLTICALPIATQLRNPIAAVHSYDQTGRLFVAEQIGIIHVVTKDRKVLPTPFLDISNKVLTSSFNGDERGLLGLAFHPNFKNNSKFYVYYSTRSSRRFDEDGNYISHISHVSQYIAPGGGNVADPSSEEIVMKIPQPESNHNGGQLLFKDELLLIFLGDGGGGGDRHGTIGHGLDRTTLLGSVLCINVTTLPYTIPEDNPFVNQPPIRPEIYAYGLRNPWRCCCDRGDLVNGTGKGRIICGDVGQNAFEEIDIIEKGGNYGWRAFEGFRCFDRNLCSNITDAISPIYAYPHRTGRSVTGGYVYRGCLFPNLQDLYFFADFERGIIWVLREIGRKWEKLNVCMGGEDICHSGGLVGKDRAKHITSFGEDEYGELYILATDNASPHKRRGAVYQVIEPERRADPSKCH